MAGFGSAPTSVLPTPGVTAGPSWASALNTAIAELQSIVTPKIGNTQIDLGTDADVKHGSRTVRIGAAAGQLTNGAATIPTGLGDYWQGAGAGDTVCWALPLADNDRLLEVSVYGEVAVASAWSWGLWQWDPIAATFVRFPGGGDVSSTTSPGRSKVTATALNLTQTSPTYFQVRWVSGAANNKARAVEYKFDKITLP